ncbi:MFS transporter [Micrococcales bacterium 31B]|nr:MFS transporter [Micrococcales bacterium 31B]
MTTKLTAGSTSPQTFLDRIGIPSSIKWGFVGIFLFMCGNGVESGFITPHLIEAIGGDREGSVPQFVTLTITLYSLSVLICSYLAGALSDLWGPRKVMMIGAGGWLVFEALLQFSILGGSQFGIFASYFLRGMGFPLFAFAFLVWINKVTPREKNATAVGWFYVMFTGGLPTIGSLFGIAFINLFGGGFAGEQGAMWASMVLVGLGTFFALGLVKDRHGYDRLAHEDHSSAYVLLGGVRLLFSNRKVMAGFWVRLINTAPEFGMLIIMPAVISAIWGQDKWLLMTTIIFAGNILFNAFFGWLGDKFGWRRTVQYFGVIGSAIGLLLWWYVPQWVGGGITDGSGSGGGYAITVILATVFGIMLAGFVPMGAIMPNIVPEEDRGAAIAMYTTAAGGATFLGSGVVLLVHAVFGNDNNVAVVWAFVILYAIAFFLTKTLKVPADEDAHARHH